MNRKIVISMLIGIGFVTAGVVVFVGLARLRQPPEQKDFSAANLRHVNVLAVAAGTAHGRFKGFGTVKPRVAVAIPAEVPGRITWRNPGFETGALLEAGAELFRIDPDTFRIQVQKAESNLASSLAQREILETEIKGLERSIKVSADNTDLARRELERFERLARVEATSKSQVDKMQIALQSALTGKVKDENSLRQAVARRAAVEAGIRQAEAALAEAKLNLSRTEVRAPFRCRVESRKAEAGEFVAAGRVLGDIYDPATLEVHVPTSLDDLAWLLPDSPHGQPQKDALLTSEALVTFCLQGKGGDNVCWHGRVTRLAGAIDERTRTVEVVVEIPDTTLPGAGSNLPLLKGTFVEVELQGRALPGIFKIPRAAVSRNDTVNLFVAGTATDSRFADGRLEVRAVEVVRFEGEIAYVAKGLAPGDRVITTILPEVIPGLPLALASGAEALTAEPLPAPPPTATPAGAPAPAPIAAIAAEASMSPASATSALPAVTPPATTNAAATRTGR